MILRKKNVYLKLQVASKSFQTLGKDYTRPIQSTTHTSEPVDNFTQPVELKISKRID